MNIEELIAAANPVPYASIPPADSPVARQTLARVRSEVSGTHGQSEPKGRDARRLPLVLGGLATAAAASLAIALLVPGAPGRQRPSKPRPNATAAALDALAVVAAAQPVTPTLRRGQFQYTDEKSLNWIDTYNTSPKDDYSVSYMERRQVWIALNGSGRLVQSYSDPDLPPRYRAGWIAAGRPSLWIAPSDQRFGRHQLSLGPKNLLTLPTDPAKLAALLFARKIEGGPPGPAEDFVQIGDLLRETDAPPALRAALFKVAERIPGTKLLGTVTDQAGRSGLGIAYISRPTRGTYAGQYGKSELIFNAKTSALLAEQTVLVNTRTGTTTVTSWTVYLKSGVVNSVTSTTPVTGTGSAHGSGPT